MPEKSAAFWIAVVITIFALFASAMVLVEIVRLRRIERKASSEAKQKRMAKLTLPPKPTLD